ncbi:type 2 lanthipeptide synthetase LanM family protein [Actinokineospora bangkokensis]|uniref:Lanthionine synthetase C family protein n=1 Tax=Actinokineospora bangkokensis TaxID=1193682 RepID=A0A1Q9LM21_9PSEU|nr:type 2 lanthipeptide synthetase LanM family protein [Actinokineospora bangkokensis]OLR93070.1 lanthionine synthetase C family protein [Actinokineospora bangkokensis]
MSSATSTTAADRPQARPTQAWWACGLAVHERGTAPGDPATGAGKPAWAEVTERAVERARFALVGEVEWRAGFAELLAPFADLAAERVSAAAGADVDAAAVAGGVRAELSRRLVAIAARTLVTELHRLRAEGALDGADGAARFQDFLRRTGTPDGLAGLFGRYPVLARLLAQAASSTAAATAELLGRLAADRADLVAALLGGTDPGRAVAVVASRGDRHAGGRSVAFVEFADGRSVVYKPQDLTPHVRFAGLLSTLGGDGLFPGTAAVLARPGYGWTEFITAAPLADRAAADRFHHRQGALLAVLHAVRATDVHYENLIARGDEPVLVDIETLFQPALSAAGSGDPAADALAESVHRTALLPVTFVGEQGVADLSGTGGDAGASPATVVDWLDAGTDRMRLTRRPATMAAAANRPVLDGAPVDPAAHEAALLAGFRAGYDRLVRGRAALVEFLRGCADVAVRVVVRPTWVYSTLLDETTHPDLLADAAARDSALTVLHQGRVGHPLLEQFLAHELTDLWAGDVPLFTAVAGTGELRAAGGAVLPVPLPLTGLAAALETADRLGAVDRRDQEWVISASLATRGAAEGHPQAPALSGPAEGAAGLPDELLAAASGIADRIVAGGIAAGGRVNWLGLEAVEDRHWLVMPLGAGLGSGHLGVALFLAQLAEVTGIGRYADQARAATAGAPAFVAALATRPDLVAAIGPGGLHGLGGIAYGLTRLGALLDAPELTDAAATAAGLAAAAATAGSEPGWAGGLAGGLAALTAVHAELGLAEAAAGARRCADLLVEHPGVDGGGFADGAAGVGYALVQHGPDDAHRGAGRHLLATAARGGDGADLPAGWCRGAAGFALARAAAPVSSRLDPPAAFAGGPVRRDLSLCHGELGTTEVLAALAGAADRTSATATALRKRTGLVLGTLRRHGPLCGVPGEVTTPGLLTGLAGIGHGLLRLAAPKRVPSVLLLQKTPA